MDHYRNQLYGSITQSKFGIDPMFPAGDITILLICLFGWKMPNNVPFFGGGLGVFEPLNIVGRHPNPQRHILG